MIDIKLVIQKNSNCIFKLKNLIYSLSIKAERALSASSRPSSAAI